MHSFNHGIMLDSTEYVAGKPVEEAREIVKDKLIEEGKAVVYYELPGPVESRYNCWNHSSGNRQRFLPYSQFGTKKEREERR